MGGLYIPRIPNVIVRVEGPMVLLIDKTRGTLLVEFTWQAAKELSRAIRFQAAKAEQNAKISRVINDQAVLIRKGFPIALDPRPAVLKEAGKEAAHNRELRRSMPGSIPSGVVFGFPSLRGKPAKARIGASGIPSGEAIGKIGGN